MLGQYQLDLDRRAEAGRQVRAQQFQQGLGAAEPGLVEGVQVQLEGFRFDDVGRVGRHREGGDRHLRLAAQVQPRDFVGIPQIEAEKRQAGADPEFVALGSTRDRKQQRRVVLADIGGRLAERRAVRRGETGHGKNRRETRILTEFAAPHQPARAVLLACGKPRPDCKKRSSRQEKMIAFTARRPDLRLLIQGLAASVGASPLPPAILAPEARSQSPPIC